MKEPGPASTCPLPLHDAWPPASTTPMPYSSCVCRGNERAVDDYQDHLGRLHQNDPNLGPAE